MNKIGYMAQSDALYASLTAAENLHFFGTVYGMKKTEIKKRIREVMELVNLSHDLRKPVGTFSGGMKRRLSLAIAVIHKPPVLVLDEPTVGIDPFLRKQIWEELNKLAAKGVTILVTTHVMDEADKCHSLALMREGRLIAKGNSRELRERVGVNSLEEAFIYYGGGRMRIRALAFRILNQLRHDRRTMALMLCPYLSPTLVYFILEDTSPVVSVAVINAPAGFEDKLEEYNVRGFRYGEQEARLALEQGGHCHHSAQGREVLYRNRQHNPTKAKIALAALEQAKQPVLPARPDLKSEIHYVYGREDLPLFDMAGPTLIGFIIFFFVFLVSGISFLQERTSGTLEKLLSTPIRRWEIVVGYVLGFSLATVLQSFLISWYCVYVLKVMMIGSFFLILLITLLTAVVALTLGMLISTLANNEFQMIQFIPLVIVPQVFFSGLFDLPPAIANFGYLMPLYYIADALTEVMIRGRAGTLTEIWGHPAYSIGFMNLNTLFLKKYRRI